MRGIYFTGRKQVYVRRGKKIGYAIWPNFLGLATKPSAEKQSALSIVKSHHQLKFRSEVGDAPPIIIILQGHSEGNRFCKKKPMQQIFSSALCHAIMYLFTK